MQRMTSFVWRDGERTIRFGRAAVSGAVETLGGPGYVLLTTPRAAAQAPAVAEAAARVHHVGAGGVPELAGEALSHLGLVGGQGRGATAGERVVALGGGRVIDVAKAVAAALGGGARAMAVPTTLSGAEMTRGHRHAEGVAESTPRVRCAVVVCDPALAASQPLPELAASALNALGHAVEAPCTLARNPVATVVAHDAARRLARAFAGVEPDRDELALGALLAGYVLDSTGFGLHHVMAQTLVRRGIAGHGPANAVMLPHTIPALARRTPEEHAALTEALGEPPEAVAARICALTGAVRLRDLGAGVNDLDACARAAAERRELDNTPPRAHPTELRALYAAAW